MLGTVCPRSSDPFYVVTYYIKWVTTSRTHSMTVTWQTTTIIARGREIFIETRTTKKEDCYQRFSDLTNNQLISIKTSKIMIIT